MMREQIGSQLGNYRIMQLIGQGGFSDVYLGEHVYLKTQAAIKVLHTKLTQESLQDFLNEARMVARLRHPSIIRVFEFGVEENAVFLIMDYAPNGTLRQRYPRGTRLAPKTVAQHIGQVAAALQYAHQQNLIHRDVKPENMLLGHDNEILLSDFGVATVSQNSLSLQQREIVGTLSYIAPEQLRGRPRPASDQYALGVVAYEWLTGVRPFGGSHYELVSQQIFAPPPPLHEKMPSIPLAVESVVLKALEKDPHQRFSNIQAFAEALEQACVSTEDSAENAFMEVDVSEEESSISSLMEETLASTVVPFSQHRKYIPSLVPQPAWLSDKKKATTHALEPFEQDELSQTHKLMAQGSPFSDKDSTPPSEVTLATLASVFPSDQPSLSTFATQSMRYIRTAELIALSRRAGTCITTYTGHSDWIRSLSWSQDQKYIASASNDETVHIWNAETGSNISVYRGHTSAVHAVAWSPNGQYIASASSDKTVQIWNSETGQRTLSYKSHAAEVYGVAWSPVQDAHLLASVGADRTVRVWNAETGDICSTHSCHSDWVRSVAWSPDGKYVASASNDKTIVVWDVALRKRMFVCHGHEDWVRSVAWSPDGKYIVSASNDQTVRLWDASNGSAILTYDGHNSGWLCGVLTAIWAPKTTTPLVASAGEDQTVQVWNILQKEKALFTYREHSAPVDALSWSPDGAAIASAGHDAVVRVWQILPAR